MPHNYVTVIAADEKGYLLLGTASGIARFDGMRFTPFERFGGMRVFSLLKASDGALWVGGSESGLHVLRAGKVQSWYEADGIGKGTVYSLLEDRWRRIWAVAHNGLLRIDQDRPRTILREVDVDGELEAVKRCGRSASDGSMKTGRARGVTPLVQIGGASPARLAASSTIAVT